MLPYDSKVFFIDKRDKNEKLSHQQAFWLI